MSIQFGRWNTDGKPVDQDYFEKISPLLTPYGPDGAGSYSKGNISILYGAFHTTKESRRESQPHVTSSGAILTWDGRVDNRAELIDQLGHLVTAHSADVEIVSAAYEYWREQCFAMLIGDWALSIWNPHTRSLILAKDPIGTRHLYYSVENNQVTWSTILDPLVLFSGKSFTLCEEYIAGWFSFFPATHLTPYIGIHSVPPSSSVLIREGKHTIDKFWDFDPAKKIRYRSDAEYEEHFRTVFCEAVGRRLRSDNPILAELSGGMDSSSIVCMADTIIARGVAETPRLDTVSYYDDSEPNWNERPYFEKVEQKRGRTGCHIDAVPQQSLTFGRPSDRFAATPGSGTFLSEAQEQFTACITSQRNRVVLSGIGGDEATGGVPTPIPEFENLIARAQFKLLAHQLKVWALNKRKPWFHLFFEAARGFLPPTLLRVPKHRRPAVWLHPIFAQRHRIALTGYESRVRLIGPLPSFLENISALNALRRQLACDAQPSEPCYEKRYPYLDRSLLEFLYGVPREQLVRPGQRRSLMRRALVGILPEELLNRKRKAFVARGPRAAISQDWITLMEATQDMVSASFGILDQNVFSTSWKRARQGQEVQVIALMRTLFVESWLRGLRNKGILASSPQNPGEPLKSLAINNRSLS